MNVDVERKNHDNMQGTQKNCAIGFALEYLSENHDEIKFSSIYYNCDCILRDNTSLSSQFENHPVVRHELSAASSSYSLVRLLKGQLKMTRGLRVCLYVKDQHLC